MATTTHLSDIINPEVMGDAINFKLDAMLKHIRYAKIDKTLQGVPGDTKTVPAWKYIGDADEVGDDDEAQPVKLEASSAEFTIKCITKCVSITQKAINSGYGKPVDQAEVQLAKAVDSKVNSDLVDCVYGAGSSRLYAPASLAAIDYSGIVKAETMFQDEEDEIEKVMFIHPAQEAALLLDPLFQSKDKFGGDVAVRGCVGKAASCWIKKSKKVALINCEASSSGGGGVQVTAETQPGWRIYDADSKRVIIPAVGSYVKALTVPYYLNQIIKLEPDSDETEATEAEAPALTVFLKEDLELTHDWVAKRRVHELTLSKYYGVGLTNESKVLLAKFKA